MEPQSKASLPRGNSDVTVVAYLAGDYAHHTKEIFENVPEGTTSLPITLGGVPLGRSTVVIEAIAKSKANEWLRIGYYGEKEIVVTGGVNTCNINMDYGVFVSCSSGYSGSWAVSNGVMSNGVLSSFNDFATNGWSEIGSLPLGPDDVFVIPKGRTAPRHMINRLPKQSHIAGWYFWGYAVRTTDDEHNPIYKMIDTYSPDDDVKYKDGEGYCFLYSVWEGITAKTTLITLPPSSLNYAGKIYCGVGSKFKIPVVFEPAGAPAQTLTWRIEDANGYPVSFATVDGNGVVTTSSEGEAIIEIDNSSNPPDYNTKYELVITNYSAGDIIFNDGQKWTLGDLQNLSNDREKQNAQKAKAVGVVFWVDSNNSASAKMVGLKEETKTWYDAMSWASSYSTPATAGSAYATGWYLPNVNELQDLYAKTESLVFSVFNAVVTGSGDDLRTADLWSSTDASSDDKKAWYIDFTQNLCDPVEEDKTKEKSVHAIRVLP